MKEIYFKRQTMISTNSLRCMAKVADTYFVGSLDGTLRQVNLAGVVLKEFDFFDSPIYSIAHVEQLALLAVGLKNGNVFLLKSDGDIVDLIEKHKTIVSSLCANSAYLVSGAWDGKAIISNLADLTTLRVLADHKHAVTARFLAGGCLVTGSQDGKLHLHGPPGVFDLVKTVKAHDDILRNIVVGDSRMFTISNDGSVCVLTLGLDIVERVQAHSSFIYSIEQQGAYIFTAGEDYRLSMLVDRKKVAEVPVPSTIWAIDYISEFQLVVCFCQDGQMRVFQLNAEGIDLETHKAFVSKADINNLKHPDTAKEALKRFPPKTSMAST